MVFTGLSILQLVFLDGVSYSKISVSICLHAVILRQIYLFHYRFQSLLISSSFFTHSLLFLITSLLLYPSSVQLLQDAQASEGQVVVLECRVRGGPPLQVRWSRQGEEILDSPDFRILQKSEAFFLVVSLLYSS